MVLKSKKATIAYRCPSCGHNIMGMVGIFMLSGDMIKLKCDCGKSELVINRTPDGKIHLTVPCIVCPNPHSYTLSEKAFFDKDLTVLSCTYSDVDTCFIGEEDKVTEALRESDEYLESILDDAGFDSYEDFITGKGSMKSEAPSDLGLFSSQVDEIVRFVLSELKAEDAIHCGCKNPEDAEYDFEILGEQLHIFCTKCGNETFIPMTGTDHASAFLNIDNLNLTDMGNSVKRS